MTNVKNTKRSTLHLNKNQSKQNESVCQTDEYGQQGDEDQNRDQTAFHRFNSFRYQKGLQTRIPIDHIILQNSLFVKSLPGHFSCC